jgi:hypothetical protein
MEVLSSFNSRNGERQEIPQSKRLIAYSKFESVTFRTHAPFSGGCGAICSSFGSFYYQSLPKKSI